MKMTINGKEVDYNDPNSIKKAIRNSRIGWLFVICGCIVLYFISADKFICNRSQNICSFQERHIWQLDYITKDTIALSDIRYAYKESHRNSDGDTMYKVFLKTTTNSIPLSNKSTNMYSYTENKVKKINSYLNSGQENLEITESILWLLFPFLFIFAGLFISVYLPYSLKKRLKDLEEKNGIDMVRVSDPA